MKAYIAQQLLQRLPLSGALSIVDCGARFGEEEAKWSFLGEYARLYGFEADEQECVRLNRSAGHSGIAARYYPLCLGRKDGERRQLHVTRQPHSSSLYVPAESRFVRWKASLDGRSICRNSDHLTTERVVPVTTSTLDHWAGSEGIRDLDYMKLDVQGAELDILEGAQDLLAQVLGIEVEVEFVPLYRNQPLFADVDAFLRQRHFTFFNLRFSHSGHFVGRLASPVNVFHAASGILRPQMAGQLVTADAIYLVDPLDPDWPAARRLSLDKYLKLIIVAEVCGQVEFAFELLSALGAGSAPISETADPAAINEIFDSSRENYAGKKSASNLVQRALRWMIRG